LSLTAMIVVSQFVAQRVSKPLAELVGFARDVSDGTAHRRAPAGDDEIGQLGAAFNDMLDRIEHSRKALVQSEKLGLAGLMAARVAHDIRNPLSSIKMQTQLLKQRVTGCRGKQGHCRGPARHRHGRSRHSRSSRSGPAGRGSPQSGEPERHRP
jgi:nitrogen fixation/metabolism regulation signal transduction histidine kinase